MEKLPPQYEEALKNGLVEYAKQGATQEQLDEFAKIFISKVPQQEKGAASEGQPATSGSASSGLPSLSGANKEYQDKLLKMNFVQRMYDPNKFIQNEDGSKSTHKMASAEVDGKNIAFPTIVEKAGKLYELGMDDAIDHAMKTGEYAEFANEKDAQSWAEGGYKKGTPLESLENDKPKAKFTIGTSEQIPQGVQKEVKRQVAAQEEKKPVMMGDITGVYEGEEADKMAFQAENYNPLKQAQAAAEYENTKQALRNFNPTSTPTDIIKGVAEGQKEKAFFAAQNDYLNSIQDPQTRESEQNRLNEIRNKPIEELSYADKEYLTSINDKALSNYVAAEKNKIYELTQDSDMEYFIAKADNLNTQYNAIQKQMQALASDNKMSATDKQTRMMELEATAARISEKYDALSKESNVPPEKLAALNDAYGNIDAIRNASDLNMKVLGQEAREFSKKARANERTSEGQLENFGNSFIGSVINAASNLPQIPKVIGDLLGDTDYDVIDKVFYEMEQVKASTQREFGRKEGFEDLPLYAKIPTMLGEGLGSVATLAVGGGAVGITAASYLTTVGDFYEEAIKLGMNPQEASVAANSLAVILGKIETLVPDTDYVNAKQATRTVIGAMQKGMTYRQATNAALKELLPSIGEYIGRTGISGIKEAGEEAVGAIGEGFVKNVINTTQGKELYKDTFTQKGVEEQALMGFVTGGALAGAGRLVAARRSPVQESALMGLAENPQVFENALENMPELEGQKDLVNELSKIRESWEKIPSFQKLDDNVKSHIISEALRVKQLTKAAKDAGADPSTVAAEVDDANANIMYAQSKNRIRGEKETPSPTMEWEGEDVKPKTQADDSQDEQGVPSEVGGGQAVVETQPIEGTGATQVGPSGNVQALEREKELNQVRQRINAIETARKEGRILQDETPNELKNLKAKEKELSLETQVATTPLSVGSKIQWNVFGNEDMNEWTVAEKTTTRGGQPAVRLTRFIDQGIAEGGGRGGYTAEHIVPISELQALEEEVVAPKAEEKNVNKTPTMDDFDTFKDAVNYNVKRTAEIALDESAANYGDNKNIDELKQDLNNAGIAIEKVDSSKMTDGNYASYDGEKIKVTDENIPLQVLLHEIGEKVISDLDKSKTKIEHSNNIFESVTTYGASRGNDAFADNFYLYFLSPQTLKDLSPNVFNELDKLIPSNIKELGVALMSKYGVTEQVLKYNKPQATETPMTAEQAVVEEAPQITPEEEAAGEQEFAAAVENVKAVDPTLTEDEADQAAALVQSGETVDEAVKHVKEVVEKQAEEKQAEEKAENPQNKLIHFKSLYNKLGKKDKKTKGANLYNKIQELSKELGFSVIINPKNGDVRFLDKKGRRVAKLGVDRSANANVADLKKAVAWANQNGTPEAKALLFFVEGNSVSSNEIERYFLKNTEEVNSLIKKGLVVKSSSSNKAEIIQDVEDNPNVSAGEAESVFKEIVDVLLTYGDKKVMANELVDLYNKAMEVEGGQENLSDQELQERQEYYDRLEKEQEYIDAMQSIDELANEWDALPKEEQEKIINIVQYESEIDERTKSVFNEALPEREEGGRNAPTRSEKRVAKKEEDLTPSEKQALSEISERKQEIESEIASIKKQKAAKEREVSKRIQDNAENLFGEKNNKREQELFEDEIDASNKNLRSILGEYDNKIKSLQEEYGALSLRENDIYSSEKAEDLFAQEATEAKSEAKAKAEPMAKEAATEIFEAIDNESTDPREKVAQRRENKAKFGAEEYAKAVKVTKNFDKIIQSLEKAGEITKKCP